MKSKRILIVRDGDFFFYVHQLAVLLRDAGNHVTVLHTDLQDVEPLYASLKVDLGNRGIPCHTFIDRPRIWQRVWTQISTLLRLSAGRRRISNRKIRHLERSVDGLKFDFVFAVDSPSLYLACKAFPEKYDRIIHYSLEVIEESHPLFQFNSEYRSFVEFERNALPRLAALMIQDRFREDLFLTSVANYDRERSIYFPVACSGTRIDQFKNGRDFDVLFYGGLWSAELIDELRKTSRFLPRNMTVRVRGGRGCLKLDSASDGRFIVDRTPVPFDELDNVIARSQIGIALYPQGDANNRTTAFSSEKIARYTKCGIPFVAFDNCDYRFLKSSMDCCELITSFAELPEAIMRIAEKYDYYRTNAFRAFEQFYSLSNTSRQLLSWLERSVSQS